MGRHRLQIRRDVEENLTYILVNHKAGSFTKGVKFTSCVRSIFLNTFVGRSWILLVDKCDECCSYFEDDMKSF